MESNQVYATVECVVAVYEQAKKTLFINQNALDSELIQAFQQILILEFNCLVSYVEPKILVEHVGFYQDSDRVPMSSKSSTADLPAQTIARDFSQ